MMKRFSILKVGFCIVVAACSSPHEKQRFALKDAAWHTYTSGEYLRYQFVGVNNDGTPLSGDWITRWQTVRLPLPIPSPVPVELMRISNTIATYNLAPWITNYYVRPDQEYTTLFGFQQEGVPTVLYLRDSNNTYGVPMYPASFAAGATQALSSLSLTTCNDNLCTESNNGFGTVGYQYSGIQETVETPYGYFECYRLTFNQNYLVAGASYPPLMNGTVWVYPPLGMVKARMNYTDAATGKSYTYDSISLVETNIKFSQ